MPAVPTYPPHTARIRDVYLPGDGPRPRFRRSKSDSQQAPKPRHEQPAPLPPAMPGGWEQPALPL